MANLIRRGLTFYARLTILQDRWEDVGRAYGSKGGIKREVVRTLQTRDRAEALRRREPALAALRQEVDAALKRAKLRPLTDWTADWTSKALKWRAELQAGANVIDHWESDPHGEGSPIPTTRRELLFDDAVDDARHVERLQGPEARHRFEAIAFGDGLTIAEATRQWITEVQGSLRDQTARSYEATIALFGGYLRDHEALPSLEAVTLSEVSRRIAGEFIASRRADRAWETVQKDHAALSGLWRWAVRRGYAEANPWADQTAGLKATRAGEDAGASKRAYATPELVALLHAGRDALAPSRGGYAATLWDVIRLGLLTGARANEVLSLTFGDVIEDGTAIATSAKGKTDSAPRIIPLHPYARKSHSGPHGEPAGPRSRCVLVA